MGCKQSMPRNNNVGIQANSVQNCDVLKQAVHPKRTSESAAPKNSLTSNKIEAKQIESQRIHDDGHLRDSTGLLYRDVRESDNIHAAIKKKDLKKVQEILARGCSINDLGMWSCTPLITATQYGCDDIIKYLLSQNDVNINHINEKGGTAILYACIEEKVSVVQKLLTMGSKISPPIMTSVYIPKIDKMLPATPFSVCCIVGNVELFKLFQERGFDRNHIFELNLIKSLSGRRNAIIDACSPLVICSHYKNSDLFKYLIHCGADFLLTDSESSNILHHLAHNGTHATEPIIIDMFNHLLEMKCDVGKIINCINKHGDSPLLYAITNGLGDYMGHLLEAGADCDTPNPLTSLTPLHCAVRKRNIDMVHMLLQYEADPFQKDKNGLTVLDMTKKGILKDSPIHDLMESFVINRAKKSSVNENDGNEYDLATERLFLNNDNKNDNDPKRKRADSLDMELQFLKVYEIEAKGAVLRQNEDEKKPFDDCEDTEDNQLKLLNFSSSEEDLKITDEKENVSPIDSSNITSMEQKLPQRPLSKPPPGYRNPLRKTRTMTKTSSAESVHRGNKENEISHSNNENHDDGPKNEDNNWEVIELDSDMEECREASIVKHERPVEKRTNLTPDKERHNRRVLTDDKDGLNIINLSSNDLGIENLE